MELSAFTMHIYNVVMGPKDSDETANSEVPDQTAPFIGLRNHLVIGQLNAYQFFSDFHWSTSNTPLASQ